MSPASAFLAQEVMAQPEGERLAYALQLISQYIDPLPAFVDGVARMRLDLAVRDIRILHALDKRRGTIVTRTALQAAAMADVPADHWGGPETISRRVAAIRRCLDRSPYPAQIIVWRGLGYSLTAPDQFTFEGASAPDRHAA